MTIIKVNVHLKPKILDPQGRAVQSALSRFGLTELADVRQGKQFILTFADEVTASKLGEIEKVAATLLCNPVIEDFTIEVKE